MPPSYRASYVGRFAPPGMPNTVSTPSALRHSMMASTARMTRTSFRGAVGTPSLAGGRRPDVHLVRVRLVGAAAAADLRGDRHHEAALVTAAARLLALEAVEQGGDGPDQRQCGADQEPDQEGAALDLPDEPGRQAEDEHQDEPLHAEYDASG